MSHQDRQARLRHEDLQRLVANLARQPTTTQRQLVQVYDGGSIPTAADHFYLTHPVSISGDVCEGCPGTFVGDTNTTIVVDVLGQAAVAGDVLDAHLIGGRWVAEKGTSVNPCNFCVWFCGPIVTLSPPSGPGTQATAAATVKDGKVSIKICLGGSGYTSNPHVTITAPPPGGTQATATAIVGGVVSISVTNAGSGYVAAPHVTIAAPGGSGTTATATATINGAGQVTGITINSSGSLYTVVHPVVTIDPPPPGGVQATAVATARPGVVTSITVTNPGSSYVDPAPPAAFDVTIGAYGPFRCLLNKNVSGQPDGADGGYCFWDFLGPADYTFQGGCPSATLTTAVTIMRRSGNWIAMFDWGGPTNTSKFCPNVFRSPPNCPPGPGFPYQSIQVPATTICHSRPFSSTFSFFCGDTGSVGEPNFLQPLGPCIILGIDCATAAAGRLLTVPITMTEVVP